MKSVEEFKIFIKTLSNWQVDQEVEWLKNQVKKTDILINDSNVSIDSEIGNTILSSYSYLSSQLKKKLEIAEKEQDNRPGTII